MDEAAADEARAVVVPAECIGVEPRAAADGERAERGVGAALHGLHGAAEHGQHGLHITEAEHGGEGRVGVV